MFAWDICRLCLQTKIGLQSNCKMNKLSNVMILDVKIAQAYKYCIGLNMDEYDDRLPNEICEICKKKLIISYSFKKQCVDSNRILETHLETFSSNPSAEELQLFKNQVNKKKEKNEKKIVHKKVIQESDDDYDEFECDNGVSDDESEIPDEDRMVMKYKKRSRDEKSKKILTNEKGTSDVEKTNENVDDDFPDFSDLSSEGSIESLEFETNVVETVTNNPPNSNIIKMICTVCGLLFSKRSLRRHLLIHKKLPNQPKTVKRVRTNKTMCDLCGKLVFHIGDHLKSHEDMPYEERPYACDLCDKRFKVYSSLYGHKQTHTNELKHKCPHCDELFRGYHTKVQHITQYHTGEYRFECNLCDAKFWLMARFKEHQRRVHDIHPTIPRKKMDMRANPQLLECEICGKKFKSQHFLREHMESHDSKSDDNDYECPVCQQVCSQNSVLRSHIVNLHPEFNLPPHNISLKKKSLLNYQNKKFHR